MSSLTAFTVWKKPLSFIRGTAFFFLLPLVLLSGCLVLTTVAPDPPKQGDNLSVHINTTYPSKVENLEYKVNSITGSENISSKVINLNTCKSTGDYLTKVDVWGRAKWQNGKIRSSSKTYDLTIHSDSRENAALDYGIYVAEDDDEDTQDLLIGMANGFFDEFNKYSSYVYYWAEPWFYTAGGLSEANSHDMAISCGHGGPHRFRAGNTTADRVDISATSYGGFHPCNGVGDLEYLVFASCSVLSMDDSGGLPYWQFWRHILSSRLEDRPFTGLHMTCGFRTWLVLNYKEGKKFMDQFAENLNNNMSVINSWQEAVGDELDFDDGYNRGTVFYLKPYENDKITTRKGDYIFGNGNYNFWYDTWED